MTRYVILGTGVAGVAAAEAIRVDASAEIIMVGDDPHGYYSRPGLAYYLTGEMLEKHLFPFNTKDFAQLKVRYVRGHAKQILRETHQVEIEGAGLLHYDKLLIAVGAQALRLSIPGAELEGVAKLDSMEDARRILQLAKKARRAIVIGGGITALELVEGLVSRNVKVTYLLRGDRYWNNVLDEHESRIIEGRLKEEGVELIFHAEALEISGRKGHIEALRLLDGRTLKCDFVAYAIGIQPRLELAQNAALAMDRGILVNEFLQTNDADIYAAGDVAQIYDPLSGRSVLDSLWGPARLQGFVAGKNMSGGRHAYIKAVPFNVTRLAGLTTTIIGTVGRGRDEDIVGIARGDSETFRALPEALETESNFDVNHLRLVVGQKTLLGAVLMGDQSLSVPLQKMIIASADISSIRPTLLEGKQPIADVLIRFWQEWRQHDSRA